MDTIRQLLEMVCPWHICASCKCWYNICTEAAAPCNRFFWVRTSSISISDLWFVEANMCKVEALECVCRSVSSFFSLCCCFVTIKSQVPQHHMQHAVVLIQTVLKTLSNFEHSKAHRPKSENCNTAQPCTVPVYNNSSFVVVVVVVAAAVSN